jgi:hypothetical protein
MQLAARDAGAPMGGITPSCARPGATRQHRIAAAGRWDEAQQTCGTGRNVDWL